MCPTGFAETGTFGNFVGCRLTGVLTSDLTLPFVEGVAYQIDGRVDVGVDTGLAGAAPGGNPVDLTIEPGVVLFGSGGADYLVVNRGSRIIADGEENNPIIFTSQNDLARQADSDPSNDKGEAQNSEWGGLVLLGQAPINECNTGSVGVDCENIIEGVTNPDAIFGGNDTMDDSGILRYIQVRFAGFDIDGNGNELNGISFGGVGNTTTLEFIQVHNNLDDGVEFFGGTVDARYLVLTGNFDDSIDTDLGWTGRVQFAVVAQRDDASEQGDNAFEMSGDTNPHFANVTIVGGGNNAFRINSGHIGQFDNFVVSYDNPCFNWEASAGDGNPSAFGGAGSDPSYRSSLFDCTALTNDTPDTPAAVGSVGADGNNVIGASSLMGAFLPGPNELAVMPVDFSGDPFFEDVGYIGAFGPTETETNNWATGWTFALFPEPECPFHPNIAQLAPKNGVNVCGLSGVVQTDLELTRGNFYEILGRVDVGIDDGLAGGMGTTADLSIEPGVTLFGDGGADYIVVQRGSRMLADGTANNPIIFTSEADVDGTGSAMERLVANSEWGGLVLLGQAPINECNTGSVGVDCENIVEGVTNPDAIFGGNQTGDDSGVLRYVQVKYAGFDIDGNGNELNGISFAGVGDTTVVDHLQVHNNLDDGVEFFGGTVNVSHVVLTGNFDDSMDTDLGWVGAAQYVLIIQRDDATEQGDNAFEMSGVTNPNIANFTVVGGGNNAFRINSGHIGRFFNGVVAYASNPCFRWEASAGDGNPNAYGGVGNDPSFDSVLFDCTALTNDMPDTPAAVGAVNTGSNNTTNVSNTLVNTFVNGTAESSATEFQTMLSSIDPFFEDTDYIGAVEDLSDTWWQGWTCSLENDPC